MESDSEDRIEQRDTVTAEPLKKGRSQLESGFIENVQIGENANMYFIKAHAHHSTKNECYLLILLR